MARRNQATLDTIRFFNALVKGLAVENSLDADFEAKDRPVLLRAVLSMGLLWLSFPPVAWSALAFVALVPLFGIVLERRPLRRRAYRQIWFAGVGYWLATFYFVPIPHPALWAGWIVLAVYLACYLPLFVLAARSMANSLSIPVIVAIPIGWTVMEWIRCHLLTGMGLVCLSHTQFHWPIAIQIAEIFGGYGVTFAIAAIGACLATSVDYWRDCPRKMTTSIVGAFVLFAAWFGYGAYVLNEAPDGDRSLQRELKVGLIQGSIDTVFPKTEAEWFEFERRKNEQYVDLTVAAMSQWKQVDLIVWPENGWPTRDLHPGTDRESISEELLSLYANSHQQAWWQLNRTRVDAPMIPLIVGAVTDDPPRQDSYGSAILIDSAGVVTDRYFKNHLVMFGEYIPLSNWIPLLQSIPAIGKGLAAGTEPAVFEIDGIFIAPNICFESTVPHFIRKQLSRLSHCGPDPDIMLNVTNDGWFYGTSCLDFHLACNVFRAIEMRKPNLVCANTGFSAHIDDRGRIIQQGPRRLTQAILANVTIQKTHSLYRAIGDIPVWAMAMLVATGLFVRAKDHFGTRQSDNH